MKDRRGLEELSKEECLLRLGRGGVGRVAVVLGAMPAIFPVNYATLDGDIVFLTAPGTKLTAAERNSIVAFEVDGSDRMSHSGWSVMVVGPARPITDPDERTRATALPLTSWAGGSDDVFVRIESRLVSGRALTQPVDRGEPARTFPLEACPPCGSDAIAAVHDGEATNFVSTTCLATGTSATSPSASARQTTRPGCDLIEPCRAERPTVATTGGTSR